MSLVLKALRVKEENQQQEKQRNSPGVYIQEGAAAPHAEGSSSAQVGPSKRRKLVVVSLSISFLIFGGYFGYAQWLGPNSEPIPVLQPRVYGKPNIEIMLRRQAERLFKGENFKESAQKYQRLINAYPKNPLYHNGLGLAYLKMGDYSTSELHFREAIELDARCTKCLNNLGYLLSLQSKSSQAERYLLQAAESDTAYPDPHFNLAVLYEQNGDTGRARREYAEFLRLHPEKHSDFYAQVREHRDAIGRK